MSESIENFFTVTKKPEGKYRQKRILFILGYIIFGLLYFFGLFAAHLYAFIAFIILFEWILIFFTWRYVSIEYKYEIVSSNVNFYTIYGGKSKKLVLTRHIKDFEEIKPLDSTVKDEIKSGIYKKVNDFRSSENSEDGYYASYTDENENQAIVCFDGSQKTLKLFKYYNSKTVIKETRY